MHKSQEMVAKEKGHAGQLINILDQLMKRNYWYASAILFFQVTLKKLVTVTDMLKKHKEKYQEMMR